MSTPRAGLADLLLRGVLRRDLHADAHGTTGCGLRAAGCGLREGIGERLSLSATDVSPATWASMSPGDLSVVGFDDIPESTATAPPLTTVHQPIQRMGATAVQMLVGLPSGTPLE